MSDINTPADPDDLDRVDPVDPDSEEASSYNVDSDPSVGGVPDAGSGLDDDEPGANATGVGV